MIKVGSLVKIVSIWEPYDRAFGNYEIGDIIRITNTEIDIKGINLRNDSSCWLTSDEFTTNVKFTEKPIWRNNASKNR